MLSVGFSGKIAFPTSAALRIVDPSVSLESVAFLSPGVGVPQQTFRLPTNSGPQDRPRLKGCRFRLNKLGILLLGVGPPVTEMTEDFFSNCRCIYRGECRQLQVGRAASHRDVWRA